MKRFLKRFFLGFIISCVIVCLGVFSSSAASQTLSTFSDVTYSTSQIGNLLSIRSDEELRKNYVALRSSQSTYVLVLADEFNQINDTVTADNATCIVYDTELGYNNATRYYSIDYDFVSIGVNHVVVSNFLEGASRPDNTNFIDFITIAVVIIICLLIFKLLRGFK